MVVAVWVCAYGILKAFSQSGMDIDSAEQVYFAQSWQMGYGTRQPPLYTWLLLALKPVSMSWTLALELARYVVLALWLWGVQVLAASCGASRLAQGRVLLVHLGAMLVLWRVHDSLTHTVLGACLTTWATVLLLRALNQPRYWVLVGGMAALACLSKLNALVWCLSSLVASVLHLTQFVRSAPAGVRVRAHVGQQLFWMCLGLLLFLLLMAPYAHWWVLHRDSALALAREIVVTDSDLAWWRPTLEVLLGGIEYVLIGPLLVLVWAWRHRHKVPEASLPVAARWIVAQAAVGLLVLGVLLTAMRGAHFTPRWLWPVMPGLTVWMAVWACQVAERLDLAQAAKGWRFMLAALPVMAIALAAVRVWEPARNAQRCVNCWTDRPAQALSDHLHATHGASLRILTGDDHLAGILAAVSPSNRTWAVGAVDVPAPAGFAVSDTPCIAAWVSMNQARPAPPHLATLLSQTSAAPVFQASWPLRLAPQRQMWLQSVRLAPQACTLSGRNATH